MKKVDKAQIKTKERGTLKYLAGSREYEIKKIGFAVIYKSMRKGRGLRLIQSINKCEKDGIMHYCTFARGDQGGGAYNDWACYVALNNQKQGVVLCGASGYGWYYGYVRQESNPDLANRSCLVITSDDERERYFHEDDAGMWEWGDEECGEMFSRVKIKDDKDLRLAMLRMVEDEVNDWSDINFEGNVKSYMKNGYEL